MRANHPRKFTAREVGRYVEMTYRLDLSEPPQRIDSSPETAAWRLVTRTQEAVAKIFRADQLDAVRSEIRLLGSLRDAGIRVPRLQASGRGDVVGLIGSHWWSGLRSRECPIVVAQLERMRRANAATVTRDEMMLIARAIGAMHAALRNYPHPAAIRPLQHWRPQLGCFDDLLRSPDATSFGPGELAQWRALDCHMEQVAAAPWDASLTASVLHGDLGLEHVRLIGADTRVPAGVYFFDFSDFARGPIIYDLAVMASRLYWEADISLSRWRQLRDWLCEGYATTSVLDDNDWKAYDAALIERLLIEVRFLSRVALRTNAPYRPDGIRKRYRLAEHVLAQSAATPSAVGLEAR